jgi:hypothetical protein
VGVCGCEKEGQGGGERDHRTIHLQALNALEQARKRNRGTPSRRGRLQKRGPTSRPG